MEEFICEAIDVERLPDSPRPVRFRWRGEEHEIVELIREWVDVGHGDLPAHSRRWYNRRHERCFEVRDAKGGRFVLRMDYSHRERPIWYITRRITGDSETA